MLLLDNCGIVPEASPQTALDEEMMQVDQSGYRHAWLAELHSSAGDRIQHPCRHDRDHAGRHFNMDNPTTRALLAVVLSNAATMERVPAVMDFNLLPDMSRMTRGLRLAARTISSRAPMAVDTAGRWSARS